MSDASVVAAATSTVRRVDHRRRWATALRDLPIRALGPLADIAVFALSASALGVFDGTALVFAALGFLTTRPNRQQRVRLDRRPSEDLVGLAGRVAVATVATAALATSPGARGALLAAGALALPVLLAARTGVRFLVHAVRRQGVWLDRAVVVGAGPVGVGLARVLRQRPEFGLQPVGFVERDAQIDGQLPVLGPPEQLPQILADEDVRRIIIAFGATRERELLDVLRDCSHLHEQLKLHVLPRFYELGVNVEGEMDDVWGFPLVPVRSPGPGPVARHAKRTFDLVVGIIMLVLLAPVMGALALAVRLTSPGPVLFRQERIGQHGRVFELLKFRSMRVTEDEPDWAPDDSRVTAIGRLIRPTHLDELPQLFNVLKGDMALVGPRPERPRYVAEFGQVHEGYDERHRVPVGLTGWAQVNGLWGDTSIADRARFDNRYIEDWSLWRDLTILARTIPSVFGQKVTDEDPPPAASLLDDDAGAHVRRVLHVVQPTDGGAARYVADVAACQAAQGMEVHVASPRGGRLAGWLAGSAVHHLTWDAQRSPTAAVNEEVRALGAIVADVDPHLVHLHASKAGLVGRLSLRGSRPTVFQPHCWSFDVADGAVASAALAWERLSSRWAHGIVCVSEAERRSADRRELTGTLHVVPNGVDLEHFRAVDEDGRDRARDLLGLPAAPTALFLGRLSEDKGPDRLLDAWAHVRSIEPDAHVVVVGDGPMQDTLQARAVPGVTFAGWADDPRPWYAAADVVVLPSRWEALPLVALEAMASARSVVATDVGGLADTIGDEAGAVVPADRMDLLAEALGERLRAPEQTLLEGKQGRLRVEREHSATDVIDRLDRIYAGARRRWRRIHSP